MKAVLNERDVGNRSSLQLEPRWKRAAAGGDSDSLQLHCESLLDVANDGHCSHCAAEIPIPRLFRNDGRPWQFPSRLGTERRSPRRAHQRYPL